MFGEITDDLETYPELAASMFSGRQTDILEWAVMWKEIGADGVYLRLSPGFGGSVTELIRSISSRTRLPIAVSADREVLAEASDGISDTVMVLIGSETGGIHVSAVPMNDNQSATDGDSTVILSTIDDGLGTMCKGIEEYRRKGLDGDVPHSRPVVADITGAWDWDVFGKDGFTARDASMWEAEAALAAMMSGADMLLIRGPGAADMARVYGEELADL